MDTFLIFLVIATIIAVVILIWVSRSYYTINDDKELILNDDKDMLIKDELDTYLKPSFDPNLIDGEIASKLLERLYNINVPSNLLTIGINLDEQYYNITKQNINEFIYTKDNNIYNNNVDYVFHLRDLIGKNCDIALINDQNTRNKILAMNNYDLNELNSILDSGYEQITRDYLLEILEKRWEKLKSLQNSNIINSTGSFLYLQNPTVPNVKMDSTYKGYRINLLCKQIEFEALLKRFATKKSNNTLTLSVT